MTRKQRSLIDELAEILRQIEADWQSVDPEAQMPDEINNNDHWDAVRAALVRYEAWKNNRLLPRSR